MTLIEAINAALDLPHPKKVGQKMTLYQLSKITKVSGTVYYKVQKGKFTSLRKSIADLFESELGITIDPEYINKKVEK